MKQQLKLQFGRWLQRLGLPGMMGLGLGALSLALYFSALQPMQQRLEDARESARLLRDRMDDLGKVMRTGERPTVEQLAEFYRIFPSEKDSVDLIGKIVVIAQGEGLTLDQGEYKVNREKVGKLTRLQMILPVKGDYQQIRRFLADIGSEIPVVSLEQVEFERQKVGDSQVDADIRLAMFLGQSS